MQYLAAVLFQKSDDEHPRQRFNPIELGKIRLKIVFRQLTSFLQISSFCMTIFDLGSFK